MHHELKSWPEPFQFVLDGIKTFEYRKDDRCFEVGDMITIKEWDPKLKEYTGRTVVFIVKFKQNGGEFGIPEGYCILGM